MKYDLNKKQTIATKRTLSSLSSIMFKLLESKSFETITVQELCNLSLIPRATFYNYFEDKYDLLNYCWFTLKLQTCPTFSDNTDYQHYLEIFISKWIDFLDSNKENIYLILKHNDLSHYLINSFRTYLTDSILSEIKSFPCLSTSSIPYEITAKHCANSVLTILEWKYINKNNCSKEELIYYLEVLINKNGLITHNNISN
ncbi:MAG: TetR/AcrR family transcriptional regulator [Clostridium perfringens]|nr:TetR/AcrR family transcriptional regulator [Clostridium perfringens]